MTALIPGSFDPITLGHLNIIERTAKKFDKVYVAVMNNDSSKHDKTLSSKTYMFDMETRLAMVSLSTEHIENVVVVRLLCLDDLVKDRAEGGAHKHQHCGKEAHTRAQKLFALFAVFEVSRISALEGGLECEELAKAGAVHRGQT